MREIDLLGVRSVGHGGVNLLRRPAHLIAQYPSRHIDRLFQPDAAEAKVPPRLREEFRCRGVVHIDGVAVREGEHGQAE